MANEVYTKVMSITFHTITFYRSPIAYPQLEQSPNFHLDTTESDLTSTVLAVQYE